MITTDAVIYVSGPLGQAIVELEKYPHGRDAIARVARNLARQLDRHGIPRHSVSSRDVRIALAAHGMSFTKLTGSHARKIAGLIRNDFSR